ncbi:MAG TPA: iron ABC transporter permease [Nevskiaceae bacterium]|nr:iron ABC transporter permease [Nevskiaceae bacterium]
MRLSASGLSLALALLLLPALALHLGLGPTPLSAGEILGTLFAGPQGGLPATPVVWELRLPRAVLALLVGAALGISGAAMQGLIRNPLADPGLIGVSGGSAWLAATVLLAWPLLSPQPMPFWVLPLAAFIGGLLLASLALGLARREGELAVATLLLAGLALNALTSAGIALSAQLADDTTLRTLTFWLFGALSRSGWSELAIGAPLLLLALLALPREGAALNALLLGETEARHLGVPVAALKRRVLLLCVLAVAVAVALAGMIGFIGLIVPHTLRLLLGPDHRALLPASALAGGLLLLLADAAARLLLAPRELPVGILTAVLGAPFFLALLLRHRHLGLEPDP